MDLSFELLDFPVDVSHATAELKTRQHNKALSATAI